MFLWHDVLVCLVGGTFSWFGLCLTRGDCAWDHDKRRDSSLQGWKQRNMSAGEKTTLCPQTTPENEWKITAMFTSFLDSRTKGFSHYRPTLSLRNALLSVREARSYGSDKVRPSQTSQTEFRTLHVRLWWKLRTGGKNWIIFWISRFYTDIQ